MTPDRATVRQIISDFLVRVKKGRDELPDDLALFGDGLALDSLEAAELSVVLEDTYGRDPFSAGGELPATVGDVLGFYEAAPTP